MTYVEAFASLAAGLAILALGLTWIAGLVQLSFTVADYFFPWKPYPAHSDIQERNNLVVFMIMFVGSMLATSIMICWLLEVHH